MNSAASLSEPFCSKRSRVAAQGRERAQEETMRGLRHEYWQDSQAQMKVLRAAHEKEVAGLREQLQSKSEMLQS